MTGPGEQACEHTLKPWRAELEAERDWGEWKLVVVGGAAGCVFCELATERKWRAELEAERDLLRAQKDGGLRDMLAYWWERYMCNDPRCTSGVCINAREQRAALAESTKQTRALREALEQLVVWARWWRKRRGAPSMGEPNTGALMAAEDLLAEPSTKADPTGAGK
jgi:hypothetical protein